MTSRPAQNLKCRLEAGREFQICKFRSQFALRGTQTVKVVYPPPYEGQITGVRDREPEISCVWPAKLRLLTPTLPKLGQNGPNSAQNEASKGKNGVCRPQNGPKFGPKSLFLSKVGVGVPGAQNRLKPKAHGLWSQIEPKIAFAPKLRCASVLLK